MLRRIKNSVVVAALVSGLISGCVTPPAHVPPVVSPASPGFYHTVIKGQTLWKISKMYAVDIDDLVRINHISNVTNIEVGQLIFIPKQKPVKQASFKPVYSEDFIWPVKGKVITTFGQTYNNMVNKGINIQSDNPSNIVAARSGKVVFSKENFLCYGKTLIIDHGDNFSTVYARNSQLLVKLGDIVQRGDLIAKVGAAGRDKNMYLHFEIRKGHLPQNPYFYLQRN
ncbi:MAG: LysM peptidoglycan-binding domain-containing M23 family metallopeptidase [Candidatus Omnitrophica bacterium]|nr:LysM peptidoglycan-binding domain-containing M23 family metallopeptidase [Candidatus Omnitrophota bacterium]